MATRQLRAFEEKGGHSVGNLNSLKIRTIANGAKCTEDIDNFRLVELSFDAEGNRAASYLTDVAKKSYLIAAPERRYMGEEMVDFFNGKDEFARIVILDEGMRFDTSAYSVNGDGEVMKGQVAHFDPATKKFILSDAGAPHADYAGAEAKFLVVFNEEDLEYTFGVPVCRLEVQ